MMQELERLRHVVECQVFELCGPFEEHGSICYYVPYMMNDAVENYLILKECRLVGKYLPENKGKQEAQIAQLEGGYVLAFRQGGENAFTLFFKEIEERKQFYQYHRIGHFWVKGQEQWRQIVYIVGTIHDKYSFLGEESCNEMEKRLMHLIEFLPLQHWSPVHGSLEEDYPETEEGITAMEYFVEKANDKSYLRLMNWYRRYPWLRKMLAKQLLKTEREALYQCIYQEIQKASENYPSRVYELEAQNSIEDMRRRAEEYLIEQGYQGCYPEFQKGNRKIHVAEEHPFTILEWNHYKFRIRFMISECKNEKENQLNSGFFRGVGRKGWIEDYDYKY